MNKALVDRRETSATVEREISKNVFVVAPGVWRMKDIFVNVFIIQDTEGSNWCLVDTGLKSSASKIKKMAADIFGSTSRPSAIIMTHGHFDHRGSLEQLADEWNVPVYCHHMELPYLSGKASYPPADPTVGGGVMPYFGLLFPRGPVNASYYLQELPEDGSLPTLQEWRWLHTPGHAPGHISLFRERDGLLIAGDAVVTTKQESAISIMTQKEILCGPPAYFTPDWGASARSVKELAALEPNIIASGHGHSLYGEEPRRALHKLARNFWKQGMPETGRYVKEPALFNEEGPTYVPPAQINYTLMAAIGVAALAITGLILYKRNKRKLSW